VSRAVAATRSVEAETFVTARVNPTRSPTSTLSRLATSVTVREGASTVLETSGEIDPEGSWSELAEKRFRTMD